MTGWSLPKSSPLAILKARAYPMLPVAPVMATLIGGLFDLPEEDPHMEKCLEN